MKKKIIIISLAIACMAIIGGCKKKKKTGQVTFSTSKGNTCFNDNKYTVSINGQTATFTEYNSTVAPACGMVSSQTAIFTLPEGTYTFTFTFDSECPTSTGGTHTSYQGSKSVTITEDGCVSIRWD